MKDRMRTLHPIVDVAVVVSAILSAYLIVRGVDPKTTIIAIVSLLPLLLLRRGIEVWGRTRQAHVAHTRMLMAAVDAADPFTRDHSYRVSRMCLAVGRRLGMGRAALEELEYAALVHDLGRTALQRDVLVKKGRLTEKEMLHLQAHPRIGAELLAGEVHFPAAADIVLAHHEQPDGAGYPRGLKGDSIPVGSRVIMVVAAFDAMTSDRPYRRGLAPEQALAELAKNGGTQFFPDVVSALTTLHADGGLYADFDAAHLERYRDGSEHSRAVEAHLASAGAAGAVPAKTGAKPASDLPVIEMPGAETPADSPAALPAPAARAARTFALSGKGAWRVEAAAHTDLGCGRKNNEDAYGLFTADEGRGVLLVLADGMGGAAAGEVASRLAVETIRTTAARKRRGKPHESVVQAIEAANRAVRERAAASPELEGMGSTCTVVAFDHEGVVLGHVGDSRGYRVRGGSIEALTLDHTLAEEMARVANANGTTLPSMPSHVLTRSIGAADAIEVDATPKPLGPADGDAFVLCSDGLHNELDDAEIAEIVTAHDPAAAAEALVELARARGGADNITVVVGRLRKG